MVSPDQRVLTAILALQTDPNTSAAFKVFKDWIDVSTIACLGRAGSELDEVKLRRSQGAYMELADLRKRIETARDTLLELENKAKLAGLPRV